MIIKNKIMIKGSWYIIALGFGFMFALMLPAVFAVIAYFRYNNELIES